MTRRSILLACLMLLWLYPGCRSTEVPLREAGELTGRIYLLGNDPFTRLALELDGERRVVLICPPDVDKYLRGQQGKHAKVQYSGTSMVPEGQAVQVTSARVVTE